MRVGPTPCSSRQASEEHLLASLEAQKAGRCVPTVAPSY